MDRYVYQVDTTDNTTGDLFGTCDEASRYVKQVLGVPATESMKDIKSIVKKDDSWTCYYCTDEGGNERATIWRRKVW